MKKILLASLLVATAMGCGDDPNSLMASGSVQLTVHQAGQADGSTGLRFPDGTIIDAPPGIGRGYFGTCTRSANGWAVSISRSDAGTDGLRKIDVSASTGAGGATVVLGLGPSMFTAAAACTGTSSLAGTNGLNLTAHCVGMTATNDLRTIDGDITLSLSNCAVR